MPEKHQKHLEWTSEKIVTWAAKIGPNTKQLINIMIESRLIPEQAYRGCLGVLRLGKSYGDKRLEDASRRAIAIGSVRYKSMESILKNGLDQQPLPDNKKKNTAPSIHDNVRGAEYYNS